MPSNAQYKAALVRLTKERQYMVRLLATLVLKSEYQEITLEDCEIEAVQPGHRLIANHSVENRMTTLKVANGEVPE